MSFRVICVVVLAAFAAIHAESIVEGKNVEDGARIFLSTFTVILSTVTSTATTTSVTTCTTSLAQLTTCSAGRRRRGLQYDEDDSKTGIRRGLFFEEKEAEFQGGSASLPKSSVKRSAEPNKDAATTVSNPSFEKTNSIPLTIQSGFSLPEGFPNGTPRFKLAYGTTTLTTTMTSLSTRSLTALCASTTDYSLCANAGK